MNRRKDLLIFSNGPGEVSTWVQPVLEAVRARADIADKYRVILIMHPCQFGSGTEHRVGCSIDGIEQIVEKRAYMRMLLTGIGKRRYNFAREGIIFSLGGNLMHPVLFRKRIRGKHQLYAYSHNPGWGKQYKTIFVRNSFVKDMYLSRGVPDEKLIITGDLVYSSLKHLRERNEVRRELGIGKGERMIVFLPGSREYMTKYLIPLFLKVIDDLTDRVSGLKPFLLKSPYISYELIEESLAIGGKIKGVDSITGTLHREDGQQGIHLPSGKRVAILEGQLDLWGKGVDFAVSIPGTNTLQLAYRGIPALVVAPANKPEIVPIEGAANMVKWIPLAGTFLIRMAIKSYIKRYPLTALPNIYMNEEILPELVGVLETDDITLKIQELLTGEDLAKIGERLSCFQFDTNPVDIIVREVWGNPS
ncbi:MAG: hypothetical protein KAS61_02920 [Spirochaetes bacterium]|nr:hypothetical protein [Spirochaetota bacterium]